MNSEIQFFNLKPQQICDWYFLSTVLLKDWWKGINVLLKKKCSVSICAHLRSFLTRAILKPISGYIMSI